MIVIRPARQDDALYIGRGLRSEDELEVNTATGQSGEQIVPLSLSISREAYVAHAVANGRPSDTPCVIFGVLDDPSYPGCGIIWLLGTNEVKRCALSLLREAPRWLDYMSRHYPKGIHNTVDARNHPHLRWSLLTGFRTIGTADVNGHRFIHIHRQVI